MADNPTLPATGVKAACDEVSYSGDTAVVQMTRLVGVTGAEGSKTVIQDPISEGIGASTDSAATAGSTGSLNAKLRLATTQLDSINTKSPALGQALAAASTPVVLPALTEGLFGALTETAPATDTASSGINGRLQRIAQRLTSLIAQLPATLGIKTAAASLSVAPASDAVFVNGAGTALLGSISAKLGTDAIMDGVTPLTPKFASISASSSGNNTLVAAVVGKKIRVLSYSIVAAGAVTTAFQDGAGGSAKSGPMSFGANGGITVPFSPVGHFETTANTLLNLSLGGAVSVAGHLCYVEV